LQPVWPHGQQGHSEPSRAEGEGDWDSWNARSHRRGADLRLIFDGIVVRVRLDVDLAACHHGGRAEGLARSCKNTGGESTEAGRAILDLHDEVTADYTVIYAATLEKIETRRKAFIRKWRLKCRAADNRASSPSRAAAEAVTKRKNHEHNRASA
jgi:hypothetical protein